MYPSKTIFKEFMYSSKTIFKKFMYPSKTIFKEFMYLRSFDDVILRQIYEMRNDD